MDIEAYRKEAQKAIDSGAVLDIVFSGATYQVEVYDFSHKKSFWPFLQLDNTSNEVQDSFCSCQDENCIHQAVALLKIYDGFSEPLHLRFLKSFWHALFCLSAQHIGYDYNFLVKKKEENYEFVNDISFYIKSRTDDGKKLLHRWFAANDKNTPENSIKFSNLSPEEISWWREGRPSTQLRYQLSFWFDMALWSFLHADETKILFEEDKSGLPTKLSLKSKQFILKWHLSFSDLEKLIPTLGLIKTNLTTYSESEENIKSITYDETKKCLYIKRDAGVRGVGDESGKILGEWCYISKRGFFSKSEDPLLSRDCLELGNVSKFLNKFSSIVQKHISLDANVTDVLYEMHFDDEWNWHFEAYLFKRGDLQQAKSALFGNWVYIPKKGFFAVKNVLFDQAHAVLQQHQVSDFVNHHKIWLNGQDGFQTHLASVELHYTYSLTDDDVLYFYTQREYESGDIHDFGEWVYYANQGFFSKKTMQNCVAVKSGLRVSKEEIPTFIKHNREELENIPGFFAINCPLTNVGLDIVKHSPSSILVRPRYTDRESVRFFDDFVFHDNEGFYELPPNMRLPEEYRKEKVIYNVDLDFFLAHELPKLKNYLLDVDVCLREPAKCDLEVSYLARSSGRLKAELFFCTEFGKIPLPTIAEAYKKKKRYLFSEGGLLDLNDSRFQWISHLTYPVEDYSLPTISLTALEFIRLDCSFSLLATTEVGASYDLTRNLLKELREFTSHELINIEGLKSNLRLYQQTGLQWLWFLHNNCLSALLCDDMGLGKTHQAMALFAGILNKRASKENLFLVVCPTSVIYHWQDKLERFFPSISVYTFHGIKRSLKGFPKSGVVLTTYGILRREAKSLESIFFTVAVFDEIQIAKNPSSRVHKALTHIQGGMKLGLTGTPIENNLYELKSLFDVVLPGYMPNEQRYRDLFVTPIEMNADEEKKTLLSRMIKPFILRRRKLDVLTELPEKSEDSYHCELSHDQNKMYKEFLSQRSQQLITKLRSQDERINYVHIFSLLSHLKQICNHPALIHKDLDNYQKYSSGKWDLFVELLEEAHDSEQKVVVFSQYLQMMDIMVHYLNERKWNFSQIRGDTKDRREELKRFHNDPDCTVFIGSLQAAGLGIDLTAASVVIMYDRWWNAARENQAIDRVHRIGQNRGVQVYKLITKGTIEESIDKMIFRKGRLLEEVVSTDDQSMLKKFTRSELIELLSFNEAATFSEHS